MYPQRAALSWSHCCASFAFAFGVVLVAHVQADIFFASSSYASAGRLARNEAKIARVVDIVPPETCANRAGVFALRVVRAIAAFVEFATFAESVRIARLARVIELRTHLQAFGGAVGLFGSCGGDDTH